MVSTFNAANMLTGTTGANASSYTSDADGDTLSGGTSTFTYGADGLRRSMTGPSGVTTDYAYDGQSMVREM